MRVLILKSNTACIENINPRSPASSGRFDVVLDFVLECLYEDGRVRDDVRIYVVLSGCSRSKVLLFDNYLPYIESEEELLRLILDGKVKIIDKKFEEILDELIDNGIRLFCLFESGKDIENIDLPCSNIGFIIGDQDGFTLTDLDAIRRRNIEFVSIGPIPYLSWFCCVFINYFLDSKCRDM